MQHSGINLKLWQQVHYFPDSNNSNLGQSTNLPYATSHSITQRLIIMHSSLIGLPQQQVTGVSVCCGYHDHDNESGNNAGTGEGG